MTENEKKILLTQEEYAALRRHFGLTIAGTLQTNHYYDTDDFDLNKKGITYRIREKSGLFQATIKSHIKGSDQSEEISRAVSSVTEIFPFGNVPAKHIGYMITERNIIRKNGIDICIDKNSYLGKVDYELELEYKPGSEDAVHKLLLDITEILMRCGTITDKNVFFERIGRGKSKSERFCTFLQDIQN